MDERTEYLANRPEIIAGIGINCGIPRREIEDFTQEVLVRSMSTRCVYREDIASLKTYSSHFVKMIARTWHRSHNHLQCCEYDDNIVIAPMPAISDKTPGQLTEEIESQIRRNGYDLTERQRQVLHLLREGKRQSEIARILGISRAAIFYRVEYIRRKCRGILEKSGPKKLKK